MVSKMLLVLSVVLMLLGGQSLSLRAVAVRNYPHDFRVPPPDYSNTYGPAYSIADPDPEEDILDYANLIKQDIVMLDNSVESRTKKRANGKNNYDIEPPCSCESWREEIDLREKYGTTVVPATLMTVVCADSCPPPYRCRRNYYNVTILKKKKLVSETSPDTPPELSKRWVVVRENITTGCSCIAGGLGFY